jgi:hypothetical protein
LVLETPQHASLQLQRAAETVDTAELSPRKPGRYELAPIAGPSVARLVFVQNTGSHDPVTNPTTQLWSQSEKDYQVNQFQIAANEWFRVSNGNTHIKIDAVIDGYTGYQADRMKQSDQNMWLSEVVRSMGYTNPDVFESMYQLDNEMRDKHGTLGATTVIFLKADQPLTPDNYRSIGYKGGPFVIIRVNKLNGETWKIVKHELGHALADLPDHYNFKPGTPCDQENGYSNKKYKSEASDAGYTKDGTKRPCTQAGSQDWMRSLDANDLSLSSREAAGILDSDRSNPYTTDAAGSLHVSVVPNISSDGKMIQISGEAFIEQQRPGNGGTPLELNTIVSVDVRGGTTQQPLNPVDGMYNSSTEGFSGVIPFDPNVDVSLIVHSNIGGDQVIPVREKQQNDDRKVYLPVSMH